MPAVVHLNGFPGAGKFTVATEMARLAADEGHRMVVLDNHHFNNVVFAALDVDGIRELPADVWTHVRAVKSAVLEAIELLGPPSWSYVFTNVLTVRNARSAEVCARLAALADHRGCAYVPVALRCDPDEVVRRVVRPERGERLKLRDGDAVRAMIESDELYTAAPATLELEVTDLSPVDAAAAILARIRHGHAARR